MFPRTSLGNETAASLFAKRARPDCVRDIPMALPPSPHEDAPPIDHAAAHPPPSVNRPTPMSFMNGVRRVLRTGSWRGELDAELAFHFEQTVEELVHDGLSPAAAREEARRRFGNESRWRSEIESVDRRAAWWRRWEDHADTVTYAFRHAVRRLRRSPGFTIGVALVLALGIGANAMMFSIVDRVLLSPPPHVEDPGRVHRIVLARGGGDAGAPDILETVTYPDYMAAARAGGFSAVAAAAGGALMLSTGNDELRPFAVLRVTGSYFPLLGVKPFIGRFFTAEEDRLAGGSLVAVLGHGMWLREYGGDPGVIGQTLDLDSGLATIIGVAPPGFTGIDLSSVDVWLPLHTMAGLSGNTYCIETSNCTWLRLIGRLSTGADLAAVQAEASTRLLQVRADDVAAGRLDPHTHMLLTPLVAARGPLASGESRVALWLAAISLIVAIIACANVTGLMLARTDRHAREFGVRLALGSTHGRVMGLVLMECLLLALLAGAVGLMLSRWAGVAIRDLLLPGIAWDMPRFELRAAAITLLLSLAVGLAAAVLPALRSRRADAPAVLSGGGRGISTRVSRVHALLTIAQSGLSLVLLIAAALFVLSLQRVSALDLGLDPEGVVQVQAMLDDDLTESRRTQLHQLIAERLQALPPVEAVSGDVATPFMGSSSTTVRPRGTDSVPAIPGGEPSWHRVDPDYFRVMRLEIRRGRALTADDGPGAAAVAVVNETMARVFWPGEQAIGQCLELGFRNPNDASEELPCVRVVGVVENARQMSVIEDETMQFYVPSAQHRGGGGSLLVRVAGDEARAISLIRSELLALDPAMRYVEVRALEDLVDGQTRSWRLGATLFSLFGLLAVVVACVGLYSVLSYQVTQRTLELGVRTALGADPAHLAGRVLARGAWLVGAGVAAGIVAALLAAPRVADLLYETSPVEPRVYLGVAALLLVVSLVAAGVPAVRAARADPMAALRAE